MPDPTGGPLQSLEFTLKKFLYVLKSSLGFMNLKTLIYNQSDPGRIITPIFKAL
jgi:hypothetical protein